MVLQTRGGVARFPRIVRLTGVARWASSNTIANKDLVFFCMACPPVTIAGELQSDPYFIEVRLEV